MKCAAVLAFPLALTAAMFGPSESTTVVLPEKVHLFLTYKKLQDRRVPVLMLGAIAADRGCDVASELRTQREYQPHRLTIAVEGYTYEKGPACVGGLAVVAGTLIPIDMDWLHEGENKELVLALNGSESKYSIALEHYTVEITPIQATNVISRETWFGKPTGQARAIQVRLPPPDVAIVHTFRTDRQELAFDYRPILRGVARKNGLIPAEEEYPGLVQPRKNAIYVVVRDPAIWEKYRRNAGLVGDFPEPGAGICPSGQVCTNGAWFKEIEAFDGDADVDFRSMHIQLRN